MVCATTLIGRLAEVVTLARNGRCETHLYPGDIGQVLDPLAESLSARSGRRVTPPQVRAEITVFLHHPVFKTPLHLLLVDRPIVTNRSTGKPHTPETRLAQALDFGIPWGTALRRGLTKRHKGPDPVRSSSVEFQNVLLLRRQSGYQAIGISGSFEFPEGGSEGYLSLTILLAILHPIPDSTEFQITAMELGRSLSTRKETDGNLKLASEWDAVMGGHWQTTEKGITRTASASAITKRPYGEPSKAHLQVSLARESSPSPAFLFLEPDTGKPARGDQATLLATAGLLAPLVSELRPILQTGLDESRLAESRLAGPA